MYQKIEKWKNNQKLVLILTFSFFVFTMLFNLTHSALWGDEWVEYYYSQASIRTGTLYRNIISTFQPPLYNFVMHFWLKVSDSVWWFRFFNVGIGLFSGIYLYRTVKEIYSEKVAAVCLCVLAMCYRWIFCIQECSEYAIMLFCLFASIYYFVLSLKNFTFYRMCMFIIFSVLAIYSQYGAVFVILPLLVLFFMINIGRKENNKKVKIWLTVSYALSFVVFALPLYVFFLKIQMEHNEIANHVLEIQAELFSEMPFKIGQICGYFFNVHTGELWSVILGMMGIGLLISSVVIIKDKRLDLVKLSLMAVFWFGYILHYILVQLHIYAMIHPNQSGGFYSRYSYFYIPILCVVIPIIAVEIWGYMKEAKIFKAFTVAVMISMVCLSFMGILINWHKSMDDIFAKIWMENKGWEDTTYLYGMAGDGFRYYISHSSEYEEGYLDNSSSSVDNENLPERFWAWRTSWAGEGWQETVDKAKEMGYQVIVYHDLGSTGQLAYCYIGGEMNPASIGDE